MRSTCAALLLALVPSLAHAGASLRERFDAEVASGAFEFEGVTNEKGTLAWGASYVLLSYLTVYQATREPRYLDQFCRLADRVLAQRDSERGVKDYTGKSLPCWQTSGYGLGGATCLAVHDGMIAFPLAEFALLLSRSSTALAERPTYDGEPLGSKAALYQWAARAAAAVHDREWRDEGADRGHYVFRPDVPYAYAGKEMPVNMMNAMGRLLLSLADQGEAAAAEKARKLANHFLGMLSIAPSGGYQWSYWNHAFVEPGEDLSHAALNVGFAVRAAQSSVVFTDAHLERFATTFLEHVYVDSQTFRDTVGKTGPTNTNREMTAGLWTILAPWNPRIHPVVRDLYAGQDSGGSGYKLLALAYLVASDRFVRPFKFYWADWEDLGDRRKATAHGANLLVDPGSRSTPRLFRIRYAAVRPVQVQQWNGSKYTTVARLAPTGGKLVTAHLPFVPELYFDYGGNGVLYQLADAFVPGEGVTVMEPEGYVPLRVTGSPPSSTVVGASYSTRLSGSGTGPLRWSLRAPLDAQIDPATGAVRWTPTAAGTVRFLALLESDYGRATKSWYVTVDPSGTASQPLEGEEALQYETGCAQAAGAPAANAAWMVILGLAALSWRRRGQGKSSGKSSRSSRTSALRRWV